MTRIVNPLRFAMEVALIDWLTAIRPRPDMTQLSTVVKKLQPTPRAHLRWAFNASGDHPGLALGMPTEPFRVWTLPGWVSRMRANEPFGTTTIGPFQQLGAGVVRVISFNEPMAVIALQIAPGGNPGASFGYFQVPTLNGICTIPNVPPGSTEMVYFVGSAMTGVMLLDSATTVLSASVLPCSVANDPGWVEVERVGLPIREPGAWGGAGGDHTQKQGLVTNLMDPTPAAIDRLRRGAPPVGWWSQMAPGIAAPLWSSPDFDTLIKEANDSILPRLNIAMRQPPNLQPGVIIQEPIPKPRNLAGEEMSGDAANASIPPLGAYLINGMTDPFLALALGLGTALDGNEINNAISSSGQAPPPTGNSYVRAGTHANNTNVQGRININLFPLFMVTAAYKNGLDGRSGQVEFAAVAAASHEAPPPPPPGSLDTRLAGLDRPDAPDLPWSANFRVRWLRMMRQGILRVASVGAARRITAPPSGASTAIMTERASGGWQPIAIVRPRPIDASGAGDIEQNRAQVADFGLEIPNTTGDVEALYGVAQQNIFGMWSPWATTSAQVAQPPPDMLRVTRMDLRASAPATPGALCPAELVLEITLDWRVRRPAAVLLRGRFYSLAHREEDTPNLAMPTGFPRAIGGADAEIVITFAGDVATAPGCQIVALAEKTYPSASPGAAPYTQDEVVGFGPPDQPADTRRYRVTIQNLQLDFNARPHIGIGVWGLIRERLAPGRTGAWTPDPYTAIASDPRPPVVAVNDTVQLASLPDGRGECHAKIAWTGATGAYGYAIYQSTESKILAELGRPPPALSATLTDRLAAVKAAINAATPKQTRRAFTRRNPDPIRNATSANITLPRGSTDIHFFTIIGVSHGQIESKWPEGTEPARSFIPICAPRIFTPPPPRLELREAKAAGAPAATAIIESRPGHDVQRFELFMVRNQDAAKELDTMGEPLAIAEIPGASGWVLEDVPEAGLAAPLRRVTRTVSPQGSWKPAWFRAVAWAKPDPARGAHGGRSAPSGAVRLLIPPAAGPTLSTVTLSQPSADPADVLLEWTSPAPVAATMVGPHRLWIKASGGLFAYDGDLSDVLAIEPATPNRLWRVGEVGAVAYKLRLRRAAATDAATVTIRLTDPLGRVAERAVSIPAGSVEPAPTVTGLSASGAAAFAKATFASNAPTTPRPAGVSRLRVMTTFRRRPGLLGWLWPVPAPRTDEVDVPAIPAAAAAPDPTAAARFQIVRTSAAPTGASYEAKVFGRVGIITVTVIAPDGRTATQSVGL